MKRKRFMWRGAALLAVLFALTGCTNAGSTTSAQKVEGLDTMGKIVTVTREEGSGTRGVFAEKTNLENKEGGSNSDNIRSDAQIAINAESVVELVSADENAIGYVSLGAVTNDMEGVKVLDINGITPDSTTVGNNKYPLTRNFNIAYSGKITALGNDFLNYVLTAGQKIVSENYTSVEKTSDFLSDQSSGTLTISGSTSSAPLLELLAEDYHSNYNKKADIEIQTTDSTAGLTAAMQGAADWGMASRELKDYEKELLTYETIAKDGVAVIVNEANPATSLTIEQLTQIFDGTDKEWNDVNK